MVGDDIMLIPKTMDEYDKINYETCVTNSFLLNDEKHFEYLKDIVRNHTNEESALLIRNYVHHNMPKVENNFYKTLLVNAIYEINYDYIVNEIILLINEDESVLPVE